MADTRADDDARPRVATAQRVPPHNLQAEESLLGAMLLSKDAIAAGVELVGADDFYKPAHGHIFEAITSLYGSGEPVDPVTVADRRLADATAPIGDLLDMTLDRLEELYARGEAITGVPTGYYELDDLLAGLQPSALVIVGARPSMGKTAFALGIAQNAGLKTQRPVLLFSLEMSQLEVTQRILCAEAKVDATRVRNGKLSEADWSKIHHAV